MFGVAQRPIAAPIGRFKRIRMQIAEKQGRPHGPDDDLQQQGEGQGMQPEDLLPPGGAQTRGARMTVHLTLISNMPAVNASPP